VTGPDRAPDGGGTPRPALRPHPHLYEVNARPWLWELSRRYGRQVTLATVPAEELQALRELGFDLLYLMGVWERSAVGRYQSRTDRRHFASYDRALPGWSMDDVIGSPFAVRAYRPDPVLGSWGALAALRSRLHQHGLGLMLDFVPNHTAPDHPWVTEHPGRYVQGTRDDFVADPDAYVLVEAEAAGAHRFVARGRDPYLAPWEDTAQLDYSRGGAQDAMGEALATIGRHCDAVRCDMAMLLLNEVFARTWNRGADAVPDEEFWPGAIAAHPELVFVAEVYWDLEWRLQELGFHYAYDKRLYDRLLDGSAAAVRAHLAADAGYRGQLVRFLEDDDEDRALAAFGAARLEAVATLLATLPGMRFYHHGQLEGRATRLPVRLLRTADEPIDATVRDLYERLLRLSDQPIYHEGVWRLLDVQPLGAADDLVAYAWTSEREQRVVVVNLGRGPAEGLVRLPRLPDTPAVEFHDELHGATYTWSSADLRDGLFVRLDGHRSHVFAPRPVL
jgi:hypothetical protein